MSAADEAISTQDLIARRNRLLGPAYRLFYDQPVQFVRGEGVWLYDAAGHRYLDAYNNVASVGHCHPQIVQAIARQAAVLNTHTRYLHETVLDFAEKLLDDVSARDRSRHVHLHRQRGQRSRFARRANLHRRHRLHRHGKRLSRRHQRAG